MASRLLRAGVAVVTLATLMSCRDGEGDGALADPYRSSFVPGSAFFEAAVGDMNGDGRADLVDLSDPSVYLAPGFSAAVARFRTLYSAAVGDVDGDGDLDIVAGERNAPESGAGCATGRGSVVQTLINDGAANFRAVRCRLEAWSVSYTIALADLVGDSRPDLLFVGDPQGSADLPGTLAVAPGMGGGRFGAPQRVVGPVAGTLSRRSVVLADVDGNGPPEVLTTATDGRRLGLVRNSGGTLQPMELVESTGDLDELGTGDLDGDGAVDVLALHRDGTRVMPFRNRSGVLETAGSVKTGLDSADVKAPGAYAPGTILDFVGAGDVDGDGDTDLLVGTTPADETTWAHGPGAVRLLRGDGQGGWAAPQSLRGRAGTSLPFLLVDLDGDAIADLLARGRILLSTGPA